MRSTASQPRARSVGDILGVRDKDGRLIVGKDTDVCPDCGALGVTVDKTDRLVWYHPPGDCCPAALTRQIGWRTSDLRAVKAARDADDDAIRDLQERLREAQGFRRRDLESDLARLRKAVASRNEHVYAPKVRELAGEIDSLKRRREAMVEP